MNKLITLRDVLLGASEMQWDATVFLPSGERWALDSRCAIFADDQGDEPEFTREHGLRYSLGVAQVQDIVSNAKSQVADATADQLLAAFLFYFERDAFIVFDFPPC